MHRNANKITPEDGYEDIIIHSTSLYFVNINADGKENNLSPAEFAEVIKIMYGNNIPNIRLIACSSGILDNGAAQQLSDILNVIVKAPIGLAVIDFDVYMYVEDVITHDVIPEEDAWRIFKPRKEQ